MTNEVITGSDIVAMNRISATICPGSMVDYSWMA
jgi:hypothetical protein